MTTLRELASLLSEGERAGDGLPFRRGVLLCDGADAGEGGASSPLARASQVGCAVLWARRPDARDRAFLPAHDADSAAETVPSLFVGVGPVVIAPSVASIEPQGDATTDPVWWSQRWASIPVEATATRRDEKMRGEENAGRAIDPASTESLLARDTESGSTNAPPATESACTAQIELLSRVLPKDPAAIDRAVIAHDAAIRALVRAHAAEQGASDLEAVAPPAELALSTDLLEMVTWVESMDASQATLRRRGDRRAADAVLADLRAYLKAIRCHELDHLLAERVPIGSDEFASLVLHPSWRSDAWHLVEPAVRLAERLELARRGFASLADRIGREVGFVESAVEELKRRLETVSQNLPPGFEWSARFEQECEEHMRAAFAKGAIFGGVPRAPFFNPQDPVSAGIHARTVAFEIFGYAWSQPGAMPPSMVASREMFIAEAIAPLARLAREGGLIDARGVDQGAIALSHISRHLASRDARWKPWLVFPANSEFAAEAAERVLESAQWSFDATLSEQREGGRGRGIEWEDVCWGIDSRFAMLGSMRANRKGTRPARPWIFTDCVTIFWDGHVGLRRW